MKHLAAALRSLPASAATFHPPLFSRSRWDSCSRRPVCRRDDVYSNIGPAPQIPAGGLVERYPMINYELDQYFPVIRSG